MPRDLTVPNRNWIHLGILLSVMFLMVGCSKESAIPDPGGLTLEAVYGTFVTDAPISVAPHEWSKQEVDVWQVDGAALMLCQVHETLKEPVEFFFLLESERASSPISLSWDGETIPVEVRGTEIVASVALPLLTKGNHSLVVRSEVDSTDPARFLKVGYRTVETSRDYYRSSQLRYDYVAELIRYGVTGSFGTYKLGGFVLEGPRSMTLAVRGNLFRSEIGNSSPSPASFHVEVGGDRHDFRLEAFERRAVEVEIPEGVAAIALSANGDPNGFFLWGAPRFRQLATRRGTPVILVTLDTTRRDVLGVYGAREDVTPRIDDFASRATVYDRAAATSSWTLPSHGSIFTGLYPSQHGGGVASKALPSSLNTLAERLRREDYLTAALVGGVLSGYQFGVAQGFMLFEGPNGFETPGMVLTDRADRFLQRLSGEAYFLFVNYFDPHYPYVAPEEFRDRLRVSEFADELTEESIIPKAVDGDFVAWREVTRGNVEPSEAERSLIKRAYLAEVASMDHEVGRLFDSLQALGLFDEAMIIIVGDHGELLGEDGYYNHATRLDAGLTDIPLIIKWPGQSEGDRSGELVSLVDLFPTILEIAGADVPEQRGISLRGEADRLAGREWILMEEHDRPFHRLEEETKMGDDLYGLESRGLRVLTWEESSACHRMLSGSWHPVPCPAIEDVIEEALADLKSGQIRPEMGGSPLTPEQEESLRALGMTNRNSLTDRVGSSSHRRRDRAPGPRS